MVLSGDWDKTVSGVVYTEKNSVGFKTWDFEGIGGFGLGYTLRISNVRVPTELRCICRSCRTLIFQSISTDQFPVALSSIW